MSSSQNKNELMTKRLFDAIGALNKTILKKEGVYSQLQTELKQSEQDCDKTVGTLRSVSDSAERGELVTLRDKEIGLQKDLQSVHNEIRSIEDHLKQIEKAISDLATDKDRIDREIKERSILISIVKYVFGDAEREESGRIQREIQKNEIGKDDLVKTRAKLSSRHNDLQNRQNNLKVELSSIQTKIKRLDDSKLLGARKRNAALNAHKSKKEQIRERKHRVHEEFEKEWVSALKNLDNLCKKIRRRQPHLNELISDNINTGIHFPDAMAFGRMSLSYQNWKGYIPRLIPFPFKKSLWLPDLITGQGLIHQLILRLLHCMPVGNVEITAADPLRLGTSLAPFRSLLKVKQLFPEQRLLTRSDELENTLARLTDYVEDLLQNKFKGEIKSWSAYNEANSSNPIPYKLLLIFGVPEQLTDKSIWYLGRLLEHGPICGVLPVLTFDESRLVDRKFIGLRTAIDKHSKRMDSIVPAEVLAKYVTEINVVEEQEFWPGDFELTEFLASISERYEQSTKFSKSLTDLWSDSDYLGDDTVQGIQVPIGWTEGGELVPFSIGGVNTEHHVLLAGRSGSGKSNLLHVMIHSLCHSYSPSELNIYMLDYKEGVEFNTYASPPLLQAKLVATESDPEYGVTVLAHLTDELEKRAQEFKDRSVRDFYEYRESSAAELPRILLIIDEFQILFSEGRQVAEPAEKMLTQLLRQGRSHGIHVMLATQTLKGIQSLSMGQLISQIGCRIALTCSEEDSAMILGNSNWEAAKLSLPNKEEGFGEAIINNSNGAKSANIRFLIPFANRELCKDHITKITQIADQRGYCNSTRVFNGSRLPEMPGAEWFKLRNNETVELYLGESLSYEAEPLSLNLVNRHASNLLISGFNDTIHDGIFASILQSLKAENGIDEIIYFNGRSVVPVGASKYFDGSGEKSLSNYESISELNLAEISRELQGTKRIVIIDGLESIKEFHSGPTSFRSVKKDEPPSYQESLKQILEDGPLQGTFVIAFVENWKRCNSSCKDLLGLFEMRIGFCMNEDDAGSFVSGSIGKLKGLEKDNRAIFSNRLTNQLNWFRPYINRGIS
ncbi:FtsK/SpoIIIE domain-containing protein [Lentisphaera marina]|uniref:FtsK/SpoIIIE domain-containing protein n=1 Tax=Lentisphaera marina TaxID=1111041 RepID=UPI0023662D22|nr:FtsK/SpoIIIE domain-containing protein [Lentisphaera marina]MDD7984707.1 FtsK/SpoIIIE domain-containing protein [Lentisphaera marina]